MNGKKIGKPLKPCSILGFNVSNKLDEADIDIMANNDMHLLKLVAKGRCGVALIPDDILRYNKVYQDPNMFISPSSHYFALRLRFPKRFDGLIPQIDQVILRLKTQGEMQQILNKYFVN